LGITKAPRNKVKSIPRLGHLKFTCIVEVFDVQEVVGKLACPAARATYAEVVADATWLVLMS
jgi:hypothetical protein